MASPEAVQIGTNDETNDTNEMTNEVVNADGTVTILKKKRKKKRFEQTSDALIDKVQRQNSAKQLQGNAPVDPVAVKLDPALDAFIKLKLVEWDADQNGSFSHDEVCAAMDDLRESEQSMRKLKWQFLQYFMVVLLFLGCMLGAVFLVLKLSTDSKVNGDGEMRAPIPNADTKQTAIIQTTQTTASGGLGQLLDFDPKTDQWLISDSQLRLMDQVSFTTRPYKDASGAITSQTFHNLDLAEIIRIDARKAGNNDQVNMKSTGGHDLRLWENGPQKLEIRWKNTNIWRAVDVEGSAADNAGGRRLEEENLGVETAGDPSDLSSLEPPNRRLGKGGVIFVGYHHGHSGHGGGGGGCNGMCNVPSLQFQVQNNIQHVPCDAYCTIGACYEQKSSNGMVNMYICRGGAGGLMTPLSKWLWQGLTIVMLVRGVVS